MDRSSSPRTTSNDLALTLGQMLRANEQQALFARVVGFSNKLNTGISKWMKEEIDDSFTEELHAEFETIIKEIRAQSRRAPQARLPNLLQPTLADPGSSRMVPETSMERTPPSIRKDRTGTPAASSSSAIVASPSASSSASASASSPSSLFSSSRGIDIIDRDQKQYFKIDFSSQAHIDPNQPYGVFALQDIPEDTIIGVYPGKRILKDAAAHKISMFPNAANFIFMMARSNWAFDPTDDNGKLINAKRECAHPFAFIKEAPEGMSNNVTFRESTDRKLVMITCQPISANEELFVYKGKHMPCAYPRAFHCTRGLNPENLNRLPYIESTFTFRQRKRRASSIGTPAKRIAMGSGTPQPPPSRSFQSEDGDFNDSVFLP